MRDVSADRPHADEQGLSDLAIGATFGDKRQDLQLTGAEVVIVGTAALDTIGEPEARPTGDVEHRTAQPDQPPTRWQWRQPRGGLAVPAGARRAPRGGPPPRGAGTTPPGTDVRGRASGRRRRPTTRHRCGQPAALARPAPGRGRRRRPAGPPRSRRSGERRRRDGRANQAAAARCRRRSDRSRRAGRGDGARRSRRGPPTRQPALRVHRTLGRARTRCSARAAARRARAPCVTSGRPLGVARRQQLFRRCYLATGRCDLGSHPTDLHRGDRKAGGRWCLAEQFLRLVPASLEVEDRRPACSRRRRPGCRGLRGGGVSSRALGGDGAGLCEARARRQRGGEVDVGAVEVLDRRPTRGRSPGPAAAGAIPSSSSPQVRRGRRRACWRTWPSSPDGHRLGLGHRQRFLTDTDRAAVVAEEHEDLTEPSERSGTLR